MSEDVLHALRIALRDGEPLVLVVGPPGRFRDLVPDALPDNGFSPDLSIEQFKAKHEPDLSLSRIRELCSARAFPDTSDEETGVTPGAYKNSKGEWRITLAGIIARQRQERSDGLARRDREAEQRKAKRLAEDAENFASGAAQQAQSAEAEHPDPQLPEGNAQSVDRPGKGKWRKVLGEKADR